MSGPGRSLACWEGSGGCGLMLVGRSGGAGCHDSAGSDSAKLEVRPADRRC